MKNRFAFLWVVTLIVTFPAFAQEKTPNVHLVFETKNSNGETATLFQLSPFGMDKWIEVGRAKPSENGLLQFSIGIDKTERLIIVYKNRMSSNLFVKPDTDYKFYVNYENSNPDITNENRHDMINLFFGKWREFTKAYNAENEFESKLDGVEKVIAYDKEELATHKFLKDFLTTYNANVEDHYYIENFIYNNLLGQRFRTMMASEQSESGTLEEIVNSDELNSLYSSVRLDPKFLRLSPADIEVALKCYQNFLFYKLYVEKFDAKDFDDIKKEMFVEIVESIPTMNIPDEIKEHLLACQISDMVQLKEMYAELMPILQNTYPNSEYIPLLKRQFANKHRLNGNPAPDIKGVTISGDTTTLSSLKGKVVYVDFWATWCGPCRAEFPKSIELKKQFEGRDDVVFMYVSIDEEKDKWEKYVAENPQLKGLHLNGRDTEKKKFSEAYGIGGIPHYALINKEGIVVESNAPRPSDERTAALIKDQF